MDTDKLLEALVNLRLWLVVVAAGALGAIGALVHRVSQAPPSTLPATRPPRVPAWAYSALVGGVAAIAVLYVSNPTTGIALIGGSLVAGYAGNSILAGLEARTTAALAVREAARNETAAKLAREDLAALTSQVAALAPGASTVSGSTDTVAEVQRFARELQSKHPVA